MSELLLPVATFRRVFDTVPVQEVLTLPELVAALRRFELRPQTLARIQREIGRIRRSTARVKGGLHASGRYQPRLERAVERARAEKRDPAAAVDEMGLVLEDEARKNAKKDLRVWSPTLYRPGADKRGGDHVTHVSCVVLDFDDGTSIEEASRRFAHHFHIVHSTWSHTEEHPRFRLVLPLEHPVPAGEWPRMWAWAEEQTGFAADRAMKNASSHYALPAIPNPNWPHTAFSLPGALLSPHDEGITHERTILEHRPDAPHRRRALGDPRRRSRAPLPRDGGRHQASLLRRRALGRPRALVRRRARSVAV